MHELKQVHWLAPLCFFCACVPSLTDLFQGQLRSRLRQLPAQLCHNWQLSGTGRGGQHSSSCDVGAGSKSLPGESLEPHLLCIRP